MELLLWRKTATVTVLLLQRRRHPSIAEKIELRDEKQRLKAEKDNLEQQVKMMNAGQSFMPHPPMLPTAFTTQGQKLMMPIIGYPGFPMWQFMLPSDVDTTQDAESCPPVT